MVNLASNLKINGDRLWESILEMAKIGPGIAGGNNRQTLTDEDAKGRALFQKWCNDQSYIDLFPKAGDVIVFFSHIPHQGAKYDESFSFLFLVQQHLSKLSPKPSPSPSV